MGTGCSLSAGKVARVWSWSPQPNAEVKNGGAIPPLVHKSYWPDAYLIKHRGNLLRLLAVLFIVPFVFSVPVYFSFIFLPPFCSLWSFLFGILTCTFVCLISENFNDECTRIHEVFVRITAGNVVIRLSPQENAWILPYVRSQPLFSKLLFPAIQSFDAIRTLGYWKICYIQMNHKQRKKQVIQ
jgi:hypothetical protein